MAFPVRRKLPPGHRSTFGQAGPPRTLATTKEGKRIIFYLFGLVAVIGSVFGNRLLRPDQGPATSRSATQADALTRPPKSFVRSDTLHSLITAEDLTSQPSAPGVAAILREFAALPEIGEPKEIVNLDIKEALTFPERFRGGWVRMEGIPSDVWTISIDTPEVPYGMLFCGVLVDNPSATGVQFGTIAKIPKELDPARCRVEVEGVFLQNLRWETMSHKPSEKYRTTPFLVVRSVRIVEAKDPKTWLNNLWVPLLSIVGVLAALGTFIVVRVVEKKKSRGGYRLKTPGFDRSQTHGK